MKVIVALVSTDFRISSQVRILANAICVPLALIPIVKAQVYIFLLFVLRVLTIEASSNSGWACLCLHSIYIHAKNIIKISISPCKISTKTTSNFGWSYLCSLSTNNHCKGMNLFLPERSVRKQVWILVETLYSIHIIVNALNTLMSLRKVCMQIHKISPIFRYNMACYWHVILLRASWETHYHITTIQPW